MAKSRGQTAVLHGDSGRVVATGLGPEAALDSDAVRTAAAGVARATSKIGGTIAWVVDDDLDLPAGRAGARRGRRTRARRLRPGPLEGRRRPSAAFRATRARRRRRGRAGGGRTRRQRGGWANRARDLANAPANELTPERLAERAQELAAAHEHLSAEALGPDEIASARNGRLRRRRRRASHNPPRLIVLRYEPPDADRRRRPRPRRQGDHVRHRRHLDQAGHVHGGHEGRHGRRRPR